MADEFSLKVGDRLIGSNRLGSDIPQPPEKFEIVEPLGREGRRGRSYRAEVLESWRLTPGTSVFVKVPKVDLSDAYQVVTQNLTKIDNSFSREASKQAELADVPYIAHVLDKGSITIRNGRYSVPFLVQEFVQGIPLKEFLQTRFATPGQPFCGLPTASDWFELAAQLTDALRRVHNRGVVHGDIWPDNILMVCAREHSPEESDVGLTATVTAGESYQPYFVDFGDSILLQEESHRRVDRVRDQSHPYLAPERAISSGNWSMPADIYSLGGVLLYLATGKDPGDLKEGKDDLKADIRGRIVGANPKIDAENPGIAHIIDKCLRKSVHDRFFYADDIRNLLQSFDPRHRRPDESLAIRLEQLGAAVENLNNKDERGIFSIMASSEIARLTRQIDGMSRGHIEIVGDRELLIDYLLKYLSTLEAGDEYLTITSPQFWTDFNLGKNGRFLTMNKILAQAGVAIRRVFILSPQDRDDPEKLSILRSHLASISDLDDGIDRQHKALPSEVPKSMYTGFVEVPLAMRDATTSEGEPVAIWRKKYPDGTSDLVSIAFSVHPVESMAEAPLGVGYQQIGKIRIWSSPRQNDTLTGFLRWIEMSDSLDTYPPLVPPTSDTGLASPSANLAGVAPTDGRKPKGLSKLPMRGSR